MAKPNPTLSSLKAYLRHKFALREPWVCTQFGETFTHRQVGEALRKLSLVEPLLYRLFSYLFMTSRSRNDIAAAFDMDPSTLKRHWDIASYRLLNFLVNEEYVLPVNRAYSSRLLYFIEEEEPDIFMRDILKSSTVSLYCAKKLHEAEVADLIELFDINNIPKEYIGEMAKDLLLALDARRSYTYCWLVKEHEGFRELPPIDLRQMDYTPGARAV